MSVGLFGIQVVVSEHAVDIPWIFPVEPFVEYEPGDEWWARKYGFGRPGKPKPCAYQVGNKLVVHPAIYEQIKREVPTL